MDDVETYRQAIALRSSGSSYRDKYCPVDGPLCKYCGSLSQRSEGGGQSERLPSHPLKAFPTKLASELLPRGGESPCPPTCRELTLLWTPISLIAHRTTSINHDHDSRISLSFLCVFLDPTETSFLTACVNVVRIPGVNFHKIVNNPPTWMTKPKLPRSNK